ncbi:MAG: flagellar basal-body rod protein FlgC [Sphingomonadales bacterium]|jgi:flagellar basal-body rod protein FlgC|nr:flagellar basal-body rod protein FlgC [Sphingomonadales bacterium]
MQATEISRSALDVEWQRLQVVAGNLANINTSRTASGEPFRPLRLVSGPRTGFAGLVAGGLPGGVTVRGVETVQGNARRVYEPAHPHADTEGFVTYPAIDHAGEMTLLIRTARAYEANLTAINIAHQMYARAMQLGHQS